MDVSFGETAEVIKELRIWWINAGVFGIILAGIILCIAILAWKSPQLFRVFLEFREAKREHELSSRLLEDRISRERQRRNEKARKE